MPWVNKLRLSTKVLFATYAAMALFLLFHRACQRPAPSTAQPVKPLADNVTAEVKYQNHAVEVRTHTQDKVIYVPDKGSVVTTVNKDDSINVSIKNKGFTVEPVFGVFVGNGVAGCLGVEWGFWNRYELYGGVKYPVLAGWLGLGYRLDQLHLSNTSFYVGYTTSKELGAGLLLRL